MARWLLILTTLIFTNLTFLDASAVPGDEDWDTGFGVPGVQGTVEASTLFGGDLIIGGDFVAVGDLAAVNVARWSGAQWTALGEGLDHGVSALVVWNGELYAGGQFSGGLARWDGTNWDVVDGGVDGGVSALTVWNGALVVGGYFSDAGGGAATVGNVTIYDGDSWAELDGGTNGSVTDVEIYDGSLYICGQFDWAGSTPAANLARWNGTAWFAVGSGLRDADLDPYNAYGSALAVHGGQLVIGGQFARAGSLIVEHIVRWNGSAYSTMGTNPFSDEVTALGMFGVDLVASDMWGSLQRWNGSFWLPVGFGNGPAGAILERAGELVVGGYFSAIDGIWTPGLARYTGSWSPLAAGQGTTGIVKGIGEWNGTPIIGGRFQRAGNVLGLIAAWDGDAWTALGGGIPYAFGHSVEAVTTFGDDLVVGGSFTSAGGVPANKIARWNGAAWSAMGVGSSSTVSGLLVLDGVLYANGYWGGQQTLGRWNGAEFEPLGSGVAGGVQILYGLGAYQGDPVMGGAFTSVDAVSAINIARWDGDAWQPLGAGTSGAVFAIHEAGGLLYVGGNFQQAGGASASNVAVWDGANWSPLGAGVNGRVFGVTSLGGDIFVTGEFNQAGGQPAQHVARWDGAAWHPLGAGLDAAGHAAAALAGRLWLGGEFVLAGSTGSSRVARWQPAIATGTPLPTGTTRIALSPARPNPFAGSTSLAFELPRSADVIVDVFNLRGARVRTLSLPGLAAGQHVVHWDGRIANGLQAPAGVYFIAVRDGFSAARQRAVLVR